MDKKQAAAVSLASVIAASGAAIDGAFDNPQDILQNDHPEPAVLHLDSADGGDGDGAQDDKTKKQTAKKASLKENILALPLAVRVLFVIPLWAIGHVVTMAGGALVTALSPLMGGVVHFLLLALVMLAVFTISAKLMFPDLPLRKILIRHTIKGVLIAAVCVFGIDFAMPLIWPDYTRWKVLILGAMTLAAVSLLVFRFGRKEEKRRKEEASDEFEEQDDYVVVSSMGKSFEMKVPARAKQHRDV